MKHIFVLAMEDVHWTQLATVAHPERYRFHNIFDVPTLVESEEVDFVSLLEKVRAEIDRTGCPVDGILAQWDFPTSILTPILCQEYGVRSPSLAAVMKCEHKLWSRIEQQRSIPEVVPRYCAFDPFDDQCLQKIELEFPFWIKPIKGFSSQLGFLITNEQDFHEALGTIRLGIGRLSDAFAQVLSGFYKPADLPAVPAYTCLAEELVKGRQIAPEGSVSGGKVQIPRVFDMDIGCDGKGVEGLTYPAPISAELHARLEDVCTRFLTHIGFDDGCFNFEFLWDEANDALRLLEVNPRMSQSHSQMCVYVDGVSNHQVALDVIEGRQPQVVPGRGECAVAGKFMLCHDRPGLVHSAPDPELIKRLQQLWPHTLIKPLVETGTNLATLVNQDSYSFVLANVYLGGDDIHELKARLQACQRELQFDIRPLTEPQGVGHEDGQRVSL